MLQPSRSRYRCFACMAYAFFLHPYRVTARSEQGGSPGSGSRATECRGSGSKQTRCWRSRTKNHLARRGQNPTTSREGRFPLLYLHCYYTSRNTIPTRFRSCRICPVRLLLSVLLDGFRFRLHYLLHRLNLLFLYRCCNSTSLRHQVQCYLMNCSLFQLQYRLR